MTIFLLIFFLLFIIYGTLIAFYSKAWNQLPEYIPIDQVTVRVSVIVAVRNEENNLEGLLSCLEAQDYPGDLFEVIFVDDHSTDHTWTIIKSFRSGRFSLRALQLPPMVTSKKKAIAMGVGSADGELIITTDADCRMEPTWISTIVSFYASTHAKFIAAPVLMQSGKTFKGIFQSLDFLILQGITAASVYKRFHTMCNGANLAYQKKVFDEVNGFEGIDNIPSGDDMLLMQKIYKMYPEKVFYLKSRDAIVTTIPERTWKDFFNQRIRWASKAVHYDDKRIFWVLVLTYLVNICFLVLGVAAIWNIQWFIYLLLFLFAKIIIEFPFVYAVAVFFRQQHLMKYFPLLEPLHIIYIIIAGWLGRFGSYQWKSRTIKNIKGRKPVNQ
jgi:biofilm PGA synthesis N-glycosyltransferase PgaC